MRVDLHDCITALPEGAGIDQGGRADPVHADDLVQVAGHGQDRPMPLDECADGRAARMAARKRGIQAGAVGRLVGDQHQGLGT